MQFYGKYFYYSYLIISETQARSVPVTNVSQVGPSNAARR